MAEPQEGPTKPKIIIDEDWKQQAQAEKEALAEKLEAEKQKSADTEIPLPPPSLAFLISTLSTQAMIAMGTVANPLTGKTESNLVQARHFIDTIEMLEAKTEGNRAPEESALLNSVLHELRMGFVQATSAPRAADQNP